MTKTLCTALAAALLLCAGAGLAAAQDQPSSNPPAAGSDMNKPEMGKKKGMKGGMKEHGMDACKDDVAKFCADIKGHKQIHECLEKNEDQLSPACKKHHEAMEKHWKKGHKGMKDHDEKMEKGEKSEMPSGGQTKPSNP